jgi:sigma-B regulation protein RsbU (phosphoserine phosphatase)
VPGRDFWKGREWRLERIFGLLFILWGILSLTRAPDWTTMLTGMGLFLVGMVLAFRYVRTGIRRTIWRLRNRLIVTYIFIGVVPVFLIVLLVGLGSYIIFGQVADYLITTEIQRRSDSLNAAAEALVLAPSTVLDQRVDEVGKRLRRRFPTIELVAERGGKRYTFPDESKLTAPPQGWGDYAGLVEREGRHFEMAHVKRDGTDVTLLAPMNSDILSTMLPGMADVQFIDLRSGQKVQTGPIKVTARDSKQEQQVKIERANPDPKVRAGQHVPAAANQLDFEVNWLSTPRMPDWAQPDTQHTAFLTITTRPSAVVNTLFGTGFSTEQWSLFAFLVVAGIFLVVEIGSMMIGVSLTRTITGAVHELYEATEHVTAGDFSHRVMLKGNDQLAELGKSFNSMTENLERLIVVAKEKERLQSELEIARGVQNQLFPKAAPATKTLGLCGSCRPARMVSGDYYDYLCLPDGNIALAIGDVAGKGIAAALLMASIQSIMRTQLTSGVRNGHADGPCGSVSRMVAELNRQLYANTSAEKYATFCFGLYDEDSRSLTYTNAGHLPPILLHEGQPQLLEVTGTVVGAFPHMRYEERTVEMGPGDILVAYTDGIVEPENVYGEEFGTDRMMELVVRYQTESSEEIIERIMEAVPHWTGSQELSDDMTVVLARRV